MFLFLISLAIFLVYLLIRTITSKEDDDSVEYVEEGPRFIPTIKPNYGESEEDFEARLLEAFKVLGYEDLGVELDSYYDSHYYIAGASFHVTQPCVTFGVASRELNNAYSSRAVAIHTYQGKKVGYIPEKILNSWYKDTDGKDTPVVIFCYREGGHLFGEVFTFRANSQNYPRMVRQYLNCLKQHS